MTLRSTIGKDGRKYYFYKGKRISEEESKRKSKRKSSKLDKCENKICSLDKVCNPVSGRCVKKTGKIGRSVIEKKSKRKSSKLDKCENKICSSDKVCNPVSGRCVKKTGKIGRSVLEKKSKRKSKSGSNCNGVVCVPPRFCLEATGKCVKPCLDHQDRNPKTNRCRNKSKYKRDREKSGEFKRCPSHQYRDPKTNRCKNKPGYKRERPKKTKPKPEYESKSRWEDSKKKTKICVDRSKLELRDHQKKIVRYMDNHRGLLVVHGTGTGKTLSAVTVSQCYLDKYPKHKIVFIGPASLKSNFRKELRRYGVSSLDIAKYYRFYSYSKFLILTKKRPLNGTILGEQSKINWPLNPISLKNCLLIVDEAHNVRNFFSSTSRAVVKSSFSANKVLLLTATPFVNNLRDFIPLINMLYGRYVVGSKSEFQKGQVSDYITLQSDDEKENLKTITSLLQDKVDVVTKRDARYFPKRVDHIEYVTMSASYLEAYKKLINAEHVGGLFFKDPSHFYHGYRRAVNKAGSEYYSDKVKKVIPILKKGKALLYSNWIGFGVTPITKLLKEHGISFRSFTGKTRVGDRQSIVNDFNKGKFQVLIITKAGGEGLDLKGVKSVVVLDPTWNDAGLQQVIGRAVRYKSHVHLQPKDRIVNVYLMVLIASGTKVKEFINPDGSPKVGLGQQQVIDSGDLLLYQVIEKKRRIEKRLMKLLQEISITR